MGSVYDVFVNKEGVSMQNKDILLTWPPFEKKIKTIGHQLPDGWWYVYTPFDNDWHHVPASDVEVLFSIREAIDTMKWRVATAIENVGRGIGYNAYADMELAIKALEKQEKIIEILKKRDNCFDNQEFGPSWGYLYGIIEEIRDVINEDDLVDERGMKL